MENCPDFLDLPAREQKPRRQGITHVLDKGLPTTTLEVLLTETGYLIDVLKIGWALPTSIGWLSSGSRCVLRRESPYASGGPCSR